MPFLLVINSNFGPISHRFLDMVSFRLKTHIFFILPLFNPQFENGFFLNCILQILYAK